MKIKKLVKQPPKIITVLYGVSGSGKSTLLGGLPNTSKTLLVSFENSTESFSHNSKWDVIEINNAVEMSEILNYLANDLTGKYEDVIFDGITTAYALKEQAIKDKEKVSEQRQRTLIAYGLLADWSTSIFTSLFLTGKYRFYFSMLCDKNEYHDFNLALPGKKASYAFYGWSSNIWFVESEINEEGFLGTVKLIGNKNLPVRTRVTKEQHNKLPKEYKYTNPEGVIRKIETLAGIT